MEKILLIDGDNKICILLEEIVKEAFPDSDMSIHLANKKEVISYLDKIPDVILVNFSSQDFDGDHLCRQLKQDKRFENIPLICLTDRDEPVLKRGEALEAGVDAFLYLPVDKVELLAQLKMMFKIKSVSEQTRSRSTADEQKYQRIFENIQDVYYEASLDGIFLEISPSIEIISEGKYRRNDLIGKPIQSFYANPEDREIFLSILHKKGRVNDYELPILNKDGTIISCSVTTKICFDSLGIPEKIIGSLHDITRRKDAEKRLIESQSRYRMVFENSGTANSIFDTGYHLIMLNAKSAELLGTELLPAIGKTPLELFGHSSGTAVIERMHRVMETGISEEFETLFELSQGKAWIRSTYQPLTNNGGPIQGLQIVSHDISAQKKTELALIESETRFRALSDNSLTGIYTIFNNRIQYVNPAFANIFGYMAEELIGSDPFSLIHPDDRILLSENMRRRSEGDTTNLKYEFRGLKKSGETTIILVLGGMSVINNHPVFVGNILDITEQKQSEERLMSSKKQIATILESITDGFVAFDAQMNYTYINVKGAELFGRKPEEMIGKNYWTEYPEAKGTPFAINYQRALETQTTIVFEDYYEPWDRWFENRIYPTSAGIAVYFSETTERERTTRALREINVLNTTLLQTIPFGMDIVDEKGNILFLNEKFETLFVKESIGKKCWQLYRDSHTQCRDCPLRKGISVGETDLYETANVLGGKIFQISHTGLMYKGKKAMLEIFQDITQKKEIEKRVTLLAQSLESISECVTITDLNDYIVYVNESFCITFQYSKEEILGKHINILRRPEDKHEKARILLPAVEIGWRGEIINIKKDGTKFPILLSTSIIKDETENPIAMIGVALDITEMTRSREELIAAKEKAEEINRLKSAFLGNMSHEIRTPMNAIIGFSDLMTDADEEDKNLYAEVIHKSSIQLLALIDDVILISRLQSEKVPKQVTEFSPAEIIGDVYQMFDHPDMNNNLEIKIQIPGDLKNLKIASDANKVKQILTNLISNAVKYTLEGYILIGFELRNGQIEFFVKDTGIGISEKEHLHIFDTFYRGEQALSSAIRGTGLGLNIAKELVGVLGGEIGVTSEVNQGSRFYFTIPVKDGVKKRGANKSRQQGASPLKELTILVVDDEPFNSQYLQAILKGVVKKIDLAGNGKEAVDMASNNRYDLILMDLKMPVLDGFEATKIIKGKFPEIPVIAQSAYSLPEEKEKALAAGFGDFLTKPIHKENLIQIMRKWANYSGRLKERD